MKKIITLCLSAFINVISSNAQTIPGLQYAIHVGSGGSNSQGRAIAKDASDNVYIIGTITGVNVDFDPSISVANLSTNRSTDIFVAKYNSNGQYQWAFNIGGASDDAGLSIAVDINSNVYITGNFSGTADFNPSINTANLSAKGNSDIFVAKYNSAGQYQWAFNIGVSSKLESGNGITVDDNGNVYVIGGFSGTNVDFDPRAIQQIEAV